VPAETPESAGRLLPGSHRRAPNGAACSSPPGRAAPPAVVADRWRLLATVQEPEPGRAHAAPPTSTGTLRTFRWGSSKAGRLGATPCHGWATPRGCLAERLSCEGDRNLGRSGVRGRALPSWGVLRRQRPGAPGRAAVPSSSDAAYARVGGSPGRRRPPSSWRRTAWASWDWPLAV